MRERRLPVALLSLLLAGCAGSPPPEAPVPEVEEPRVEHDLRPVPSEAERTLSRGLVAAKEGNYRAARRSLMRVAGSCPGTQPGVEALVALLSVELDPRNPDRDPQVARNLAEAYLSLPVKPAWTAPAVETLYLMSLDIVEAAEAIPADSSRGSAAADSAAVAVAADSAAAVVTADSTVPAAAREGERPPGDGAGPREPAAEGPAPGAAAGDAAATDNGRGAEASASAPPGPILSCAVTGPSPLVGAMAAPVRAGPSVGDHLRAVQSERDSLQATVARLERQLRELRQELERIRETLKP